MTQDQVYVGTIMGIKVVVDAHMEDNEIGVEENGEPHIAVNPGLLSKIKEFARDKDVVKCPYCHRIFVEDGCKVDHL